MLFLQALHPKAQLFQLCVKIHPHKVSNKVIQQMYLQTSLKQGVNNSFGTDGLSVCGTRCFSGDCEGGAVSDTDSGDGI